MAELLSLKWKNHCSTFLQLLGNIRQMQLYTDVTLSCSGKFFHAHKVVLTACSDYFKEVFDHTDCKNPVIIMKDICSGDLELLLDYMYIGEVNVNQEDLASLVKSAECLQIKGLAAADDPQQKYVPKFKDSKKRKATITDEEEYVDANLNCPKSLKGCLSPVNACSVSKTPQQGTHNVQVKEENGSFYGIYDERKLSLDDSTYGENEFKVEDIEQRNFEAISYNDCEATSSSIFSVAHLEFGKIVEDRINSLAASIQKEIQPVRESNNFETQRKYDPVENRLSVEKNASEEHICPYCLRKFSAASSLHRHILIHTGEKSFLCNLCPYTTNRKDSLNRHMFMIHNVTMKKNHLLHLTNT